MGEIDERTQHRVAAVLKARPNKYIDQVREAVGELDDHNLLKIVYALSEEQLSKVLRQIVDLFGDPRDHALNLKCDDVERIGQFRFVVEEILPRSLAHLKTELVHFRVVRFHDRFLQPFAEEKRFGYLLLNVFEQGVLNRDPHVEALKAN